MPVLCVAADELYPGSVRPKPVIPLDIHRGGTQLPIVLGKVQTAGELNLHHKTLRGIALRRIDPFRIQQLVVQRLGKIGIVEITDGALVIGALPGFQRHAFVVADRVVVDLHIKNVQRTFPGSNQPVQVFLVVPHFHIFTDGLPAALHRSVGQCDSVILAFHGLRPRPGIGGVCLGIVMLPQVLLAGKTGNQGAAQKHNSRRRQERRKPPTADCDRAGTHEGASGNDRADAQGYDRQGDGRHDAQDPLAASALGDDGRDDHEITGFRHSLQIRRFRIHRYFHIQTGNPMFFYDALDGLPGFYFFHPSAVPRLKRILYDDQRDIFLVLHIRNTPLSPVSMPGNPAGLRRRRCFPGCG